MSEQAPMGPAAPASPPSSAAAFRLRADPPKVMRLSRKALALLSAVAATAVGAALLWALTPRPAKPPPPELYDTKSRNLADQLIAMPKDYAEVPKLGPPLPGDLGRPIVAAEAAGKAIPAPAIGPGADGGPNAPQSPQAVAAQQAADQARQLRQSARTSKLFADQGGAHEASPSPAGAGAPSSELGAPTPSPAGAPASAASTPKAAKRAFLAAPLGPHTTNRAQLLDPASPYVVQAGSVIPAALITGLRSDLPGPITAQVTENVYDSPTGLLLLIPQGARLIGEYDSEVAFGQQRLLLVWTRLILPNGQSLVLERQPGVDGAGYAGLEDGVNNHWGKLAKAALLSTTLSIGAEAGTAGNENSLVQAIRQGASQSVSQAGQQIITRELAIPPTLTIRPGLPVRVLVTRDLVFRAPYAG
ncbi:MAG: TrbI/VirB10 family protein [Pseudomonadota bacterium]|jgi:type IV secretory pathway VirB10-like protein